ncbi:hypothetical protein V5F53_10320 [Xanthobacter sp. V4C-4]|uniref:hypothetical protein n=1 Tax=Xanthobacter cornucopiae TaxID=3119924 RepID=UPI003726F021
MVTSAVNPLSALSSAPASPDAALVTATSGAAEVAAAVADPLKVDASSTWRRGSSLATDAWIASAEIQGTPAASKPEVLAEYNAAREAYQKTSLALTSVLRSHNPTEVFAKVDALLSQLGADIERLDRGTLAMIKAT